MNDEIEIRNMKDFKEKTRMEMLAEEMKRQQFYVDLQNLARKHWLLFKHDNHYESEHFTFHEPSKGWFSLPKLVADFYGYLDISATKIVFHDTSLIILEDDRFMDFAKELKSLLEGYQK